MVLSWNGIVPAIGLFTLPDTESKSEKGTVVTLGRKANLRNKTETIDIHCNLTIVGLRIRVGQWDLINVLLIEDFPAMSFSYGK